MNKKLLLIVGLGNPGTRYTQTRHNAGFIMADMIAEHYAASFHNQQNCHAEIARIITPLGNVLCAKPTTFMNDSGRAVAALLAYYKIPHTNLIVLHDESDLLIGTYRIQYARGAAGHNGVAHIITTLGTNEFWRIRIGIRPKQSIETPRLQAKNFVLTPFTKEERSRLDDVVSTAWEAFLLQKKSS